MPGSSYHSASVSPGQGDEGESPVVHPTLVEETRCPGDGHVTARQSPFLGPPRSLVLSAAGGCRAAR